MATITQSEFDHAKLRKSQEDHERILAALDADGSLEVVADPGDPGEPTPELDEEGNEVLDDEGNVVMQAPEQVAVGPAVEIEVENLSEEEAREKEEA